MPACAGFDSVLRARIGRGGDVDGRKSGSRRFPTARSLSSCARSGTRAVDRASTAGTRSRILLRCNASRERASQLLCDGPSWRAPKNPRRGRKRASERLRERPRKHVLTCEKNPKTRTQRRALCPQWPPVAGGGGGAPAGPPAGRARRDGWTGRGRRGLRAARPRAASASVFARWHRRQSVCPFARSNSAPPSAIGITWSASTSAGFAVAEPWKPQRRHRHRSRALTCLAHRRCSVVPVRLGPPDRNAIVGTSIGTATVGSIGPGTTKADVL